VPYCLYVTHAVGGTDERIEIHAIAHPDKDQSGARGLMMEQFATFDAAKAQCFLASDRERLLAVIEASFGEITQASTGWHAMSSRSVHANSLKWNLSRRHEHQTCLSPLFARLVLQ
tara:strand:- start:272 stop:619 length:348 start_codon:yes stop_codon:yes gene_type:complete